MDLQYLLIQLRSIDDAWTAFLESVQKSFPFLDAGVIASEGQQSLPEGMAFLDGTLPENELFQLISRHVTASMGKERRKHHRFDWPLRGILSDDSAENQYRVRSISAGGAYLEADSAPQTNTVGTLRIEFQNFSLTAHCEVLSPRQASSNLPPGFGVRFVDLSPDAERRIDDIVNDALMHTLLSPQAAAPVPSIGGDESLPDAFTIM